MVADVLAWMDTAALHPTRECLRCPHFRPPPCIECARPPRLDAAICYSLLQSDKRTIERQKPVHILSALRLQPVPPATSSSHVLSSWRTALTSGCFSCCIPVPLLSALKAATSVCPRQCPRCPFSTGSKAMSKSADVYGSSRTTSTLYFAPLTRYTTHLVNANNRPPRVLIIVAQ